MLPSLNALRAFDEAARTGSFRAAAEILNVSPTAVSHHIRGLESDLGVSLFHRDGRRISLTVQGRQLAADLSEVFDQIGQAVDRIRGSQETTAIRIAAGPFFAARWLMPRLETFWIDHPDISLEVVPVPQRLHEHDINADVIIEWGETTGEPLLVLAPVAIASPDFILRHGAPAQPADLLTMSLIHQRDTTSWADWFDALGVAVPQPLRGAVFEDANAVLRGAMDGQGVTLGWMPLIQSELDDGSIVRLFQETVTSTKQYHIRMGQRTRKNRDARAVISWLKTHGEGVKC